MKTATAFLKMHMFAIKCRDSCVSPRSIECNISGCGVNNGKFTLSLRQHSPGGSPANLNAPQSPQATSIWPMRTKGCEL